MPKLVKERGKELGESWAETIIEATQLMYNRDTQKRVLIALRDHLDEFIKTIPKSSRGNR